MVPMPRLHMMMITFMDSDTIWTAKGKSTMGDNYSDDGDDLSAEYENKTYFGCLDASDMSWMSDSSASDSYSDSDTSVLSFDDDCLPEFIV